MSWHVPTFIAVFMKQGGYIKEWQTSCLLLPHSRFGHYFHSNHYGRAPRVPGVSKICNFFLKINLLSFCAKIEPKLKKLQKTVKTEKKRVKNACFLTIFQILFHLSSSFPTPNFNLIVPIFFFNISPHPSLDCIAHIYCFYTTPFIII